MGEKPVKNKNIDGITIFCNFGFVFLYVIQLKIIVKTGNNHWLLLILDFSRHCTIFKTFLTFFVIYNYFKFSIIVSIELYLYGWNVVVSQQKIDTNSSKIDLMAIRKYRKSVSTIYFYNLLKFRF